MKYEYRYTLRAPGRRRYVRRRMSFDLSSSESEFRVARAIARDLAAQHKTDVRIYWRLEHDFRCDGVVSRSRWLPFESADGKPYVAKP